MGWDDLISRESLFKFYGCVRMFCDFYVSGLIGLSRRRCKFPMKINVFLVFCFYDPFGVSLFGLTLKYISFKFFLLVNFLSFLRVIV